MYSVRFGPAVGNVLAFLERFTPESQKRKSLPFFFITKRLHLIFLSPIFFSSRLPPVGCILPFRIRPPLMLLQELKIPLSSTNFDKTNPQSIAFSLGDW